MMSIWYHGSDKKIEAFDPYAFDLGNSFQKFGWSTFCFKDYEYTKKFTIMRCIQRYYSSIKTKDNYDFLHANRCTWDFVNEKPITTKEGLNFIIDNMSLKEIYIYYIDSSKLKIKGIGNDSSHNEYTFRDQNIIPLKKETIVLTKDLLEDTFLIVNDVNLYRKKLVEISNYYNRGFKSLFITYDYTINRDEIEKIIKAIDNDIINVGDDLYKFIADNNVKIVKIPLKERIKRCFLGTFNKCFCKKKYIRFLKKYDNEIRKDN